MELNDSSKEIPIVELQLKELKLLDDVPKSEERKEIKEDSNSTKNPVINNETINFQHVMMPVEEAREFFISHTETDVKSKLLQTIERTQDIKLHLHKKLLEATLNSQNDGVVAVLEWIDKLQRALAHIEHNIDILIDLARRSGIREGINGYRSHLMVLSRVLEKLVVVTDSFPYSDKPSFINTLISEDKEDVGAIRKWCSQSEVFIKQIRVVDLMIATAANMKLCSDDLLQITNASIKNEKQKHFQDVTGSSEEEIKDELDKQLESNKTLKPEDVELEIVKLSQTMDAEISSFYGAEFGFQYPFNIRTIFKAIILASASYSASEGTQNILLRGSLSLAYSAYYGLFPEEMAQKYVAGRSNLKVDALKSFWNLTEFAIAEKASSLLLPYMAIDLKITIKPIKIETTRHDGSKIYVSPPSLPPILLQKYELADPHLPVFARLISHKYFSIEEEKEEEISLFGKLIKEYSPLPESKKPKKVLSRTLVIHFHGGGFIAQGVSSHLPYLKQWAKDTSVPIFSVDYRLAPEYPYPIAFQECYYAYTWACNNAAKLGSTGERIILAGDSAGGNLATAVTVMAINDKARIPDALILAYPCLYIHMVVSPARILSIIDPLLPIEALRAIFHAYIPEESVNTLEDPYLSPGGVSDDILAQFPAKTFIAVGALDPLLDDSVYFAKRLWQVKREVRLRVFDNFPHGFLNLASVPNFGKEMAEASKQISDWISEMSL